MIASRASMPKAPHYEQVTTIDARIRHGMGFHLHREVAGWVRQPVHGRHQNDGTGREVMIIKRVAIPRCQNLNDWQVGHI